MNALRYEWSNGQVEGQVHRLKLLKRQMYGRADLDLLRAGALCGLMKVGSQPGGNCPDSIKCAGDFIHN